MPPPDAAVCDCAMRRIVRSQFTDASIYVVFENILHMKPQSALNPDRTFTREQLVRLTGLRLRTVGVAIASLARAAIVRPLSSDLVVFNSLDAVEIAYAQIRREMQTRAVSTPWRCAGCNALLTDMQVLADAAGSVSCTLCSSPNVMDHDPAPEDDSRGHAYLALLAGRGDAFPDVFMREEMVLLSMRVAEDAEEDEWEDVPFLTGNDAVQGDARA